MGLIKYSRFFYKIEFHKIEFLNDDMHKILNLLSWNIDAMK